MKSPAKLSKKLNRLNLSYARKADLMAKYINANSQLAREMNNYFGIKDPAPRKKIKTKKKAVQKRKIVNKRNSVPQYSKTNKQSYRGSNASVFDHKARPTPDLHLEADNLLDKDYFKNA